MNEVKPTFACEDSAELRAVKGQAEDIVRLCESLVLLRNKLRNKLLPHPDAEAEQCDKQAETVLDRLVANNHHINHLNGMVLDLIARYQM